VNEAEAAEAWRDLVDQLAVHDVGYLLGGSDWDGLETPYRCPADAPLDSLLGKLAHAPESRLRSAIVALLLRHPEYAPVTEESAAGLPPGDPTQRVLQVSILAAAALQREWAFSLRLYLPAMSLIDAGGLAHTLGMPSPNEEYGRPCLIAAATLLREGAPFPYNYEADWEGVVHRVLSQLRREAMHDA
jgi:hypothetical protein